MFKGQREPCFICYSVFNLIFFLNMLFFRLLVKVVKGKRRCHSSVTSNVKVNDFPIFYCYVTLLSDSQQHALPQPAHAPHTSLPLTCDHIHKQQKPGPITTASLCTQAGTAASCLLGAEARTLTSGPCPHHTGEHVWIHPSFTICSWQISFGYTFCTRNSSFPTA